MAATNASDYPQDRLQLHHDGSAYMAGQWGFEFAPLINGTAGDLPITAFLTATDVTRAILVCQRPFTLVAASSVFATASVSGTVNLEKLTGTTAPGSGIALLQAVLALSGTANTVANGTLTATAASLNFAVGDRLGIVIAGTMTSLVGGIVTALLVPA